MVSTQRDYYEVLGVERDADEPAIRNAFRKLTLKYHPDRNKSPDAEERYKEIAEAYAILSDPDKRRQYDQHKHRLARHPRIRPGDRYAELHHESRYRDDR